MFAQDGPPKWNISATFCLPSSWLFSTGSSLGRDPDADEEEDDDEEDEEEEDDEDEAEAGREW